jgi:hypothetical protein
MQSYCFFFTRANISICYISPKYAKVRVSFLIYNELTIFSKQKKYVEYTPFANSILQKIAFLFAHIRKKL